MIVVVLISLASLSFILFFFFPQQENLRHPLKISLSLIYIEPWRLFHFVRMKLLIAFEASGCTSTTENDSLLLSTVVTYYYLKNILMTWELPRISRNLSLSLPNLKGYYVSWIWRQQILYGVPSIWNSLPHCPSWLLSILLALVLM